MKGLSQGFGAIPTGPDGKPVMHHRDTRDTEEWDCPPLPPRRPRCLSRLCGSPPPEPEFNLHLQAAAVLTSYASAFRYPGGAFEPMPSREEFDEALGHAQDIYDFVAARAPREAKP